MFNNDNVNLVKIEQKDDIQHILALPSIEEVHIQKGRWYKWIN